MLHTQACKNIQEHLANKRSTPNEMATYETRNLGYAAVDTVEEKEEITNIREFYNYILRFIASTPTHRFYVDFKFAFDNSKLSYDTTKRPPDWYILFKGDAIPPRTKKEKEPKEPKVTRKSKKFRGKLYETVVDSRLEEVEEIANDPNMPQNLGKKIIDTVNHINEDVKDVVDEKDKTIEIQAQEIGDKDKALALLGYYKMAA
jgi:hypothetical protein